MISTAQVRSLLTGGGDVLDEDGTRIGSIGQVYLDDRTSEPEWVTVRTGLLGGGESFVPLTGASVDGDDVRVPFSRETVQGAPRVEDPAGHLSPDEEDELYRYYGVGFEPSGGAGHDTSGPSTDDAMTRSEERLVVGTETVRTGTARLRKFVVTEDVARTVPVTRQELRIEREPVAAGDRDALAGTARLTAEDHEIVLHEDRVLVAKETVPVERVRLDKDVVTEQRTVTEEVRREQVETDGLEPREGPR